MKRLFRGMMTVLLLFATFIPFINVNAAESSRVQIIMSGSAGNKHGTYIVSGGSFGVTINLDSSIAEFVDIGTEIILSVTPDTNYEFDIVSCGFEGLAYNFNVQNGINEWLEMRKKEKTMKLYWVEIKL